jgi:hypothetical protein
MRLSTTAPRGVYRIEIDFRFSAEIEAMAMAHHIAGYLWASGAIDDVIIRGNPLQPRSLILIVDAYQFGESWMRRCIASAVLAARKQRRAARLIRGNANATSLILAA